MSAIQTRSPPNLHEIEEAPNLSFNPDFDFTIRTYYQKTTISFYRPEPDGDLEFSTEFSPETLTRENASSSCSSGGREGGLYGLPQLWQGLACTPFKEDGIAGFRMGVNTCLSISDLDPSRSEQATGSIWVTTNIDKGIEIDPAPGTADETFWAKSTTRRPAPGTEWEFSSQVTCAARGKEREGFAWGGRGEGGSDGGQERGENQRSLRGRKEMAVDRLRGVLAHLAA